MVEVVAREGYGGLAVGEVIERAGVARSTFYEHFADKESCFLTALDRLGDSLVQAAKGVIEAAEPRDAAGSALSAILSFAAADEAAARFLFIESLAGGAAAMEQRNRFSDRIAEAVSRAWAKAPAEGPIVDLPASMVVGGAFRLLAIRLRRGPSGLRDGLLEDLKTWLDSYAITEGPPGWRRMPAGKTARVGAKEMIPSAPPTLPRGRHRLSAAEVAHDQRQRILAATAELSYSEGYSAITVTEITAAARISREVFYEHFRDKADAASEAHELAFQGAMTACAEAFFAAEEWPQRIWQGGAALVGFIASQPEQAHLGFVEPHAVGTAAVQHTYDRLSAFALLLEEGYRFRPEAERLPHVVSEALTAVMFEVAYRELREHRKAERLLELVPLLAYAILAPFMGPKAATDFVQSKTEDG
jgi:AcrR family transcriptional regulator